MKKLEECNWKAFCIDEIFTVDPGVRLTKENQKIGNRPFIGSTDSNNGITEFVSNTNKSLDRNVLGVNYNGSVVENFYHPYEAIFSDDVKRLHLKDFEDNKFVFLFIKATILQQKIKYQYGYKFNGERMKRQYIMLPVSEGKPDYAFMEEYMREVEKRQKEKYKAYIQERINELENVEKLEDKEWKPFKLIKLFDPNKGNQTDMNSLQDGDVPLVSARKVNNGLKSFVETQNLYQGHCVTLNNDGDGGAGLAYYQPFDFALDSHVTALYPKQELSKHIQVFLSRCVSMQEEFFGHGHSINSNRLNSFTIMLPVNFKGKPDYVFMENYMKRKEMEMLKRYVERIER